MTEHDELAKTVQWLADREAIRQLPQDYAHGLDVRDWAAARAPFSDDCYVKGSISENPIDPYFEALTPGVAVYQATMHFMGNQYVSLEPGADEGFVETYAVAYHMEDPANGRHDLIMAVRYCDTVARRDGQWKIVNRRAIPHWVRGPLPRPQ